jgi:cytochrome P450
MDERIHKWLAENYRRAGYFYPAQFLAHIVENAMKHEYREFSDKKVTDELAIGDIASSRRATKFSVVRAVKDLNEDREGLKDALEEGLITREVYKEELEETEAAHREVVKRYLSGKRLEKAKRKVREQASK